MVKLPDLQGYVFQDGLNVLRTGFQCAAKALAGIAEQTKNEAIDYQDAVERGGEWIGEQDEDGYVLWDHASVLEMRVEAAEEALMALRKTSIIALYHHWERLVRLWTNSADKADHCKLVSRAQTKRIPIDPKLVAIRDLANTLKHASDQSGNKLLQSRSDVFGPGFQAFPGRTNWYKAVSLTNCHVLEAFDIVSASGPTPKVM